MTREIRLKKENVKVIRHKTPHILYRTCILHVFRSFSKYLRLYENDRFKVHRLWKLKIVKNSLPSLNTTSG